MEKKAFPESASGQPEYLSSETNLLPHLEQRTSSDESAYSCTPWKTKQYSCDADGLHEEINDFYNYVKPRPSEVRMRMDVLSRVMNIVLYRNPLARIEPFGSFITGLFLSTSDLDLVVFCSPQPSLHALEKDFRDCDMVSEGSMRVLDKLSVPVIRYTDKATGVKVDISFNHVTGFDSADVVTLFIQTYPFLPKLVLLLKQFLGQRDLNESYKGGISSYCLILLVVSFLQQHPRYAGTNFSAANLGELLIEFFELYGGRFNYSKTGICVLNGGRYIAKEEIPTQDFLYVVDPARSTENAGRNCFRMWQVKQEFEVAYKRLSSAVLGRENPVPKRESILGAIVEVPQDIYDYRNWIDSIWGNHPLSPPTIYYSAPAPAPAPIIPPPPLHPVQYYHQMQPFVVGGDVMPIQQHNIVVAASSSQEHPSSTSSVTRGDTASTES
jgi:non-canonical poly(A) RNA polymerase PAPD5/7